MLTLTQAASTATTSIPAACHEVASFNFRHTIGPSFGLHTRCEHEHLSAVVIPRGIEHRFQRANIHGQMLATPDQQIPLTDLDASSMAMSGRGAGVVGYNIQTAVDRKQDDF